MEGTRVWKGFVRVPQRDEEGIWESRFARTEAISQKNGVYRQLEIKCVFCLSNVSHKLIILWYEIV